MTTDHDSDPDATVRMPRPVPKKDEADLEDVDPDSTLIREDWGSTTILPPPSATPQEPQQPPQQPPQQSLQQPWERTLRRPAYLPDRE